MASSQLEFADDDPLAKDIIRKLVQKNAVKSRSIRTEELLQYFPNHGRRDVRDTVEKLVRNPQIPVDRMGPQQSGYIYLTDMRAGEANLARNTR